jgi:uroporphyrinogen-III decarboxylase
MDNVALKQTDRVPYICVSHFFARKMTGITCKDMMYDIDKLLDATRRMVNLLEPDVLSLFFYAIGQAMQDMGYRQMKWPGGGDVSEDATFQYLDHELMAASEYDEYLFDPTGFTIRKYMPRVADVFQGLAGLPEFASQIEFMNIFGMARFANPKLQESLQTLAKVGADMAALQVKVDAFVGEMAGAGYPFINGGLTKNPFDHIVDGMRGSKGGILDMYRNKDKLMAAVDKAGVLILRGVVESCQTNHSPFVLLPMHWGLDGFMSLEQFKTFYWPPLRKNLLWLIERNLIPIVMWEGKCDSRLETIADIPRGKAVYWFEQSDIFRAKDVLGEIVCLRGNVPASMLCTGTPDDVDEYCKKLITKVGKGGGYILDTAGGIPDEAKVENVVAMAKSVKKYTS